MVKKSQGMKQADIDAELAAARINMNQYDAALKSGPSRKQK